MSEVPHKGWLDDGLKAGEECLQAALAGSRLGWSVVPCCPPDHVGVGAEHGKKCRHPGKRPLVCWKEHQATRPTAGRLRSWWRRWPNANSYLVLGPISGLVGLDVDGELGEAFLAELSAGDLPTALEFLTPGGGRRLLYAIPPGFVPRIAHQHGEKVHEGLSLLGQGGGTVLPPSRHRAGGRYVWVAGRGPGEADPAPMPDWLMDLMRDDRTGRKAGKPGSPPNGDRIPENRRNTRLASIAGAMRRQGAAHGPILAALQAVNEEQCDPPLDGDEVAGIAMSISRYEPYPDPAVVVLSQVTVRLGGKGVRP